MIFGFIRLRFPSKHCNQVFNCLKNRALIRELHVYGTTNSVGYNDTTSTTAQHSGIGTNLLKLAEWVAFKNLYPGIVVISGEGVKGYYRKRGYRQEDTFMIKDFNIMKLEYFITKIIVKFNILERKILFCSLLFLFIMLIKTIYQDQKYRNSY